MIRNINGCILSLAALLLSACALSPTPRNVYEGPEVPLDKVARIRVANYQVWVDEVDGKAVHDFVKGRLETSELRIPPGPHTLGVEHQRDHSWDLQQSSYKYAKGTVTFVAEAGHMYGVKYRREGDGVVFFVVDLGVDYDTRCKAVPNMRIFVDPAAQGSGC